MWSLCLALVHRFIVQLKGALKVPCQVFLVTMKDELYRQAVPYCLSHPNALLAASQTPNVQLDVPCQVFLATMKDELYRKPCTGMWRRMVEQLNGGVVPGEWSSTHAAHTQHLCCCNIK